MAGVLATLVSAPLIGGDSYLHLLLDHPLVQREIQEEHKRLETSASLWDTERTGKDVMVTPWPWWTVGSCQMQPLLNSSPPGEEVRPLLGQSIRN